MSNVAQGTVWNKPNYAGMLYTTDPNNVTFRMIGGLTNGGMQTQNFEFPIGSAFNLESVTQPAITETASLTAPTAITINRAQTKNVTQIFQEKVSLTYAAMANQSRLSGINTQGQVNNVPNELTFQKAQALRFVARKINYTIINGVYQIAVNEGVANKTRGLLAAVSTNAVTAGSAALTKAMIDSVMLSMFDNGAPFGNVVIITGGFQKQKISNIYGYAPEDRNVGGVNINQIETDFGKIGIVLDRDMPAASLLFADLAAVAPVYQPVPGKGNFFFEQIAKIGAAEEEQLFGQFGLDHGPETYHGKITGLATS